MASSPFRFRLRLDIAENWESENPVLAAGEPGVESDTLKLKVGDELGTAWNDLDYIIGSGGGGGGGGPVSTGDVTGLAEYIRDTIAATLVQGTDIDIDVNDGANTITVTSTATGISIVSAEIGEDGGLTFTLDNDTELFAGTIPGGLDGDPAAAFLVYASGQYPDRILEGVPMIFVGPVNPDSLGLMQIGDTWVDTDPFSDDDEPEYITAATLSGAVAGALEGVNSVLTDLQDQIDEVEATPGAKGATLLASEFPLPATGDTSQLFYLPEGADAILAPFIQCDTAPLGSSVTVTLEADQGSGFSSILDSDLAMPPGTNFVEGTTPTTQTLSDGTKLRWKVTAAPVTEVSTLTKRTTSETGTNSTTNAITNITMVKPTAAVTGDLLIAFVGRQNQTLTYSGDWTVVADIVSDPTVPQARLTVLRAINSPTLSMAVGLSSGTPALTKVCAFTGFDTTTNYSTPLTHGQNNEGATITIGSYTTGDVTGGSEPNEHVLICALSRHGAADESRAHNWGGPTTASIVDLDTSRTSANTDLHMSIREFSANQPDDTTITGLTVGNVSGVTNTSWATVVLGIREGLSAGSASRLNCQVMVR